MSRITTVHAEVDAKAKQALINKAKASKVSISAVVRWAIDAYLAAQSKEQAA